MPNRFGLREDGTPKGKGFLGLREMANGKQMSELSVGVEIDGVETLIPTIVPGLTEEELAFLSGGGDPRENDAIMKKAFRHAVMRINQGQSPFFD